MNKVELQGIFYELIGQTSSYARIPGSGTPAGPVALDLIDLAILEMVSRAKPLQLRKLKSWTLSTGSADGLLGYYDMPSDFLDYQHVEEPIRIAGRRLAQVLEGEIDSLASDTNYSYTNSLTTYWCEKGVTVSGSAGSMTGSRQIRFFPIPTSGTAKLPYVRTPTPLGNLGNSTDYFDLPERFQKACVYRAAAFFFQNKKEKPAENQDVAAWLGYFDSMVEELKRETDERLRATYRRTPPDYLAEAVEDWMPC